MADEVKFYISTGAGTAFIDTLYVPLHPDNGHGTKIYLTPSSKRTSDYTLSLSDGSVAGYDTFGYYHVPYMQMFIVPYAEGDTVLTVGYGDYTDGTLSIHVYDNEQETVSVTLYMDAAPTQSTVSYGKWNHCEYSTKEKGAQEYSDWNITSGNVTLKLHKDGMFRARWFDGDTWESSEQKCELMTDTRGYAGTGVSEMLLDGNKAALPAQMQYTLYDAEFSDASGGSLSDPYEIYAGETVTLRYGFGNAESYEFTTEPTRLLVVNDLGYGTSTYRSVELTGVARGDAVLNGSSIGSTGLNLYKSYKTRGTLNVKVKEVEVRYYSNRFSSDTEVYAKIYHALNKNYVIPGGVPENEGYNFVGWYTAKSGGTKLTRDMVVTKTSPTAFYAHWERDDSGNVSGVSINATTADLSVSDTLTLTATVRPDTATNKAVTWSVTDRSVISASSSGSTCTITALRGGTSAVTVTTVDGGYTASCSVKVMAGSADDRYLTLEVGTEYNDVIANARIVSPTTIAGVTFTNEES